MDTVGVITAAQLERIRAQVVVKLRNVWAHSRVREREVGPLTKTQNNKTTTTDEAAAG
jgi:hypothetical protein